MTTKTRTKQELLAEFEDLRQRLEEAEDTLHAISNGEVDALVVAGPQGNVVYTLNGADRPYRVLIEAMSEGALTLSMDGVILYSNTRFAELIKTPLERVISIPLYQFVAPGERAKMREFVAHSREMVTREKFSLLLPDGGTGATIPVQLSARYVDLDDLEAICVVVTDLTQVVAAEEALQRAHDELEQRVEERTAELKHANDMRLRFLAMISHELRTPLTSIKGFATTLLASDVTWDADSQREFITTIDVEADKLTNMIEQILDLSSIEAGILRITPRIVVLKNILAGAQAELQRIAFGHNLLIDVPADLPLINADPDRVAQVMVNLVSNAAKYSPADTTIRISARQTVDRVRIDVKDEGPGIPPQERAHIFEAFQRGESVRRIKGSGLGLAICRGVVEAHGGHIWVADDEGPGATVSFTVPIAS